MLFSVSRLQDVCGLRVVTFIDGGKTLLVGGCEPAGGGFLEGAPVLVKFDTATGKKQSEWKFGAAKDGFVLDVAAHPDGYLIAVTSGQPGSGKILFLRPGEKEPFYTHGGGECPLRHAASRRQTLRRHRDEQGQQRQRPPEDGGRRLPRQHLARASLRDFSLKQGADMQPQNRIANWTNNWSCQRDLLEICNCF